jgi:hypothetical protein
LGIGLKKENKEEREAGGREGILPLIKKNYLRKILVAQLHLNIVVTFSSRYYSAVG